jgi:CBS domain-containing protein
LFGGVSEAGEEPPTPRVELAMAGVGPLTSLVIGGVFVALGAIAGRREWPLALTGVLQYLGIINLVLAGFNLLPAFPLDGGRMLRAALWRAQGSLRKATRVSSQVGGFFGLLFIGLGLVAVLWGDLVGGLWWALIGVFLRQAAGLSYRQLLLKDTLRGEPVRRFMNPQLITVPRDISVADLVENYIYRYHHKMFPVVLDGRLIGCVGTQEVRDVPRERWNEVIVSDIATKCNPSNTIPVDAEALEALQRMTQTGASRMLVVDGERLAGIVSLKDLMRFIALKMELEEGAEEREASHHRGATR